MVKGLQVKEENVAKRFIRLEEGAVYFDMEENIFCSYAEAAKAIYRLPKITLIKVEKMENYMRHLTKVGRSSKLIQRKYVRIGEGSIIYNIGRHRFIEMARAAGAVYKVGDSQGSTVLVRLDVFDNYMEQFREEPVPLKHQLKEGGDMGYSYKTYSDTKEIYKKYVNASEGEAIYGISRSHFMEMARVAGAVYKVGNSALVNTEVFELYLEHFREDSKQLPKHKWSAK